MNSDSPAHRRPAAHTPAPQPNPAHPQAPAGDSAPVDRALTLLGDMEVPALPDVPTLHQWIGARLPAALHPDCSLDAAGAAVLQALARKLGADAGAAQDGHAPHLVLTWMPAPGAPAAPVAPNAPPHSGGCWSFFVIERPALHPAPHDVVELCIFQE